VMDVRLTTLPAVEQAFRDIYRMPLKLEATGVVLDTLELRVTLTTGTLAYSPKPMLHDIMAPPLPPINQSICRIPPHWCSNRKGFLSFYLPGAVLKCIRNSSNIIGMIIGLKNLIYGLMKHGFTVAKLMALLTLFCRSRHIVNSCLFTWLPFLLGLRMDLQPG